MGERFPAVTAKDVLRVLHRLGFLKVRQAGTSHAVFRRDSDGRRTVAPVHSGVIVKRKTLKAILRDADLSVEQFRALL